VTRPAARPPTDRELRLQALRKRFLSEAAAELVELAALLAAGLPAGTAPARRFLKLVHDLRGSGGSYGYPGISAAAERLEEAQRRGERELGGLLAELGEAVQAAGRP
jgi:HPt (histidine-containing phosphotransfer) domain-containing protein